MLATPAFKVLTCTVNCKPMSHPPSFTLQKGHFMCSYHLCLIGQLVKLPRGLKCQAWQQRIWDYQMCRPTRRVLEFNASLQFWDTHCNKDCRAVCSCVRHILGKPLGKGGTYRWTEPGTKVGNAFVGKINFTQTMHLLLGIFVTRECYSSL